MNPDDRQAHEAQACRTCSLSRLACEASRSREDRPCCPTCNHRDTEPDLGEPSKPW